MEAVGFFKGGIRKGCFQGVRSASFLFLRMLDYIWEGQFVMQLHDFEAFDATAPGA